MRDIYGSAAFFANKLLSERVDLLLVSSLFI